MSEKDPALQPITENELRACLTSKYQGCDIYIYDQLDSTNNYAKQLVSNDAKHGTVVLARQQTSGKGRLGRSFFSPKGGIYLSITVKPSFDITKSILITAAAAVSSAEAIQEVTGHETAIKWVNDVFVNGKKVCGILAEGVTDPESGLIDNVIIGIGINTSNEDFPQELADIAGALPGNYSRSELAAVIIRRTLDLVETIENRTFIETYRSKSMVIGKTVTVMPSRSARVLDIDDNGGLMVIYTDGSRETLTSGEISIRL